MVTLAGSPILFPRGRLFACLLLNLFLCGCGGCGKPAAPPPTASFPHPWPVISVALSPDGKTLVTGSEGRASGAGSQRYQGEVRVWDVATGQERAAIDQTQWVTSIAFSADGRRFAIGCAKRPRDGDAKADPDFVAEPGQVKVFDATTLEEEAVFTQPDGVHTVAFSPDGGALVAAGGCDYSSPWRAEVVLWDLATGKQRCSLTGLNGLIPAVAFSPDGKSLAVGDINPDGWPTHPGEVKLYDAATGQLQHAFSVPGGAADLLAFSPDGQALAIKPRARPELTFWDPLTGKALAAPARVQLGPWFQALAYRNDGSLAILHMVGGPPSQTRSWVALWRPGATEPVTIASQDREYSRLLTFSADGTTLAVGGSAPNGPANSGMIHVYAVPK